MKRNTDSINCFVPRSIATPEMLISSVADILIMWWACRRFKMNFRKNIFPQSWLIELTSIVPVAIDIMSIVIIFVFPCQTVVGIVDDVIVKPVFPRRIELVRDKSISVFVSYLYHRWSELCLTIGTLCLWLLVAAYPSIASPWLYAP